MSNRKTVFQQEIEKARKKYNRKRRVEGLNPQVFETSLKEKGVLLQIDGAKRVNLNINPTEYVRYLELARRLHSFFKIEPDPLKTKFWYDIAEIVDKFLDLAESKKHELDERQAVLDAEREYWRLKKQ